MAIEQFDIEPDLRPVEDDEENTGRGDIFECATCGLLYEAYSEEHADEIHDMDQDGDHPFKSVE